MSKNLDDIELEIEHEKDLHIPTEEEIVRTTLEEIEYKIESAKKLLTEAASLADKNNIPISFQLAEDVGYTWDHYSKTWDYWMSSSLHC